MKRTFLNLFTVGLLLITAISSCNDKNTITGIKLDKEELILYIDETVTLTATLQPYSATDKLKWSTGNSAVAVVESEDKNKVVASSKGTITAKSLGTTTITVATKDGKYMAICEVTVGIAVAGVKLDKEKITLEIGETENLIATVFPDDATIKEIIWESSNTHVAMVDNGMVIAKTGGRAIITATTNAGNFKATCEVIVPFDEPEMVPVAGGTFMMGCSEGDDECYADELPAHKVTLSSFKIAKYQVTQKLWREIMGSNPSYYIGDDLPVHHVSWDDVQVFISRLNESTGKRYRLPTEAEWEYAARGGNQSMGYLYSGSNNLDEVAWYENNSNNIPHPVGTKKPNELGIYDMSGNVREWCQDGERVYTDEPQTNPRGPTNSTARMLRGGEAIFPISRCRVSARSGWNHELPDFSPYFFIGFRLALP